MDEPLEPMYLSGHAPLVLVVDDDPVSTIMLSQILHRDGYRVLHVGNGQDALTVCEKELPDIILMDAMMPVMNGFDSCRALRSEYGDNCPPILMITGLNDSESVEAAYDVGAMDYVTKPFHWSVLRGRVRWILNAHIDHQKLQQSLSKERLLRQELKLLNQQLHHLVTVDELTGVANRRFFNEILDKEWMRLRREKASLGLVMLDIDCFKAYNDNYGHLAGDKCLRLVAQTIKECIHRPADMVARYGGEEFALILPNTDFKGAIHVSNRVKQRLQEKAIPHTASKAKSWVTASIGVISSVPEPSQSSQMLIDWADQALYEAKKSGRDRVVAYTPMGLKLVSSLEETIESVVQ
ncbi:MAG: diguanylate cyclase [Leptolyngbyaceae cyanobacterium MAG.088]|nr:diguanylate cyclase [Leptolyngbyaceae cyanobacterium MAG.088]